MIKRARQLTATFSYGAQRRIMIASAVAQPILAGLLSWSSGQSTMLGASISAATGVFAGLQMLAIESRRSMQERLNRESSDLPRIEATTDVTPVIVHEHDEDAQP
jgi:hypothetical protein